MYIHNAIKLHKKLKTFSENVWWKLKLQTICVQCALCIATSCTLFFILYLLVRNCQSTMQSTMAFMCFELYLTAIQIIQCTICNMQYENTEPKWLYHHHYRFNKLIITRLIFFIRSLIWSALIFVSLITADYYHSFFSVSTFVSFLPLFLFSTSVLSCFVVQSGEQ